MDSGARKAGGSALYLKNRAEMVIEGVEDILSFDDKTLSLRTSEGRLNIDGDDLHIGELSVKDGKLTLEGRINGLFYEDEVSKKRSGLFEKKRSCS